MATATERFTDRKQKQAIDGNWTATRGWDVIDYVAEDDAISATGVQTGDPHDLNPFLRCTNISLVDNKLSLGKVVAQYEISGLLNCPENPLLRPPIIDWKRCKRSAPVDTDINGNAILNLAYDVFKNHPTKNFSVRQLTFTRYEPYYDQATAETYVDTVNSDTIDFEGNEFDPGQVYCENYAPTESYQKGAPYIKVQYTFEIRTPNSPNLTDMQIRHPFQLRILNQGLRCLYYNSDSDDNELGLLYTADGNPVTRDVLLDDDGTPIDDSINVTAGSLDAVAAPGGLPDGVLTDVITDAEDDTTAVFLIYMLYAETPFEEIGL